MEIVQKGATALLSSEERDLFEEHGVEVEGKELKGDFGMAVDFEDEDGESGILVRIYGVSTDDLE